MANTQTTSKRAVIVPASAGSGKTYRIAHEYILDVLRDRDLGNDKTGFDKSYYKRILAVTFTNKATEEMKTRILTEIHLLASNQESGHLEKLIEETKLSEQTLRERARIVRSQILHDYSHFTVLTNDSFFQRILRAFMRELDLDMNFSTELDTAPILSKSIEALIEDVPNNSDLRNWLKAIVSERLDNGAKCDIRNTIGSLSDELFKESTKDIILNISDKQMLEASKKAFEEKVNKAKDTVRTTAQQMLDLIAERGFKIENFKENAPKYLKAYAEGSMSELNKTLQKRLDTAPSDWVKVEKGVDMKALVALATELKGMLEVIDNTIRKSIDSINTLNVINANFRSFALLNDLQAMVAKICQEENSMLLSETKHTLESFIANNNEVPFIYEKVGNYFDKFMIDEFQDTSLKEWRNFLPLLLNAISQSPEENTSVLIVGDVKQSIYRWRGGNWRILGKYVKKDLPECVSDPLAFNWRSLPKIVKFNKSLFDRAIQYENKRLNDLIDKASQEGRIDEACQEELRDTLTRAYDNYSQQEKRKGGNEGYVAISAATEENKELLNRDGMPLYIERIREVLKKGFLPRDITIIVRKNSEATEIAEEMLHYRSSFPKELWFEITTEEALSLASSPAVKLIIAIMYLAINRTDITSRVLYNHLHNHDKFDAAFSDEEVKFLDMIRTMSPIEAFNQITIRYADDLKGQSAYVLALQENISRFSANRSADLDLFAKWWQEKGAKLSVRVERSERAIEILTIHKAKGLENKVIMIPLCSWLLVPLTHTGYIKNNIWARAKGDKNLENIGKLPVPFSQKGLYNSLFVEDYIREMVDECVDGMNMLYVATTRAKEQLHIFLPSAHNILTYYSVNHMLRAIFKEELNPKEGCDYLHYEEGTFEAPAIEKGDKDSVETKVLDDYKVSPLLVQLSTPTSRYFADEQGRLSPRSVGIRLHHAFEQASTREDIFVALNEMVVNGELNGGEVEELKRQITNTLDTTIAREWFDGSWDRLYCERSIILKEGESKRPDRTMIRGREAVVVDYKFGKESNDHIKQVKVYLGALRNMGYNSVKGYVWYVPEGKIVDVELED